MISHIYAKLKGFTMTTTEHTFEPTLALVPANEERSFSLALDVPKDAPVALRKHILLYKNQPADLQTAVNTTLTVRGVVYGPDIRRDESGTPLVDEETGEVQMGIRCLILTTEGLYTSMSPIVYAKCKELLTSFSEHGMGPLEETVCLKIEKYRTKNGRLAFKLTTVEG